MSLNWFNFGINHWLLSSDTGGLSADIYPTSFLFICMCFNFHTCIYTRSSFTLTFKMPAGCMENITFHLTVWSKYILFSFTLTCSFCMFLFYAQLFLGVRLLSLEMFSRKSTFAPWIYYCTEICPPRLISLMSLGPN